MERDLPGALANTCGFCRGSRVGCSQQFAGGPAWHHNSSSFATANLRSKPPIHLFVNRLWFRTGHDFDNAHPPCPATGAEGCILGPPVTPLNGNVLQIMPWPVFAKKTDGDLRAVYEYLSAIPSLASLPKSQFLDVCNCTLMRVCYPAPTGAKDDWLTMPPGTSGQFTACAVVLPRGWRCVI